MIDEDRLRKSFTHREKSCVDGKRRGRERMRVCVSEREREETDEDTHKKMHRL